MGLFRFATRSTYCLLAVWLSLYATSPQLNAFIVSDPSFEPWLSTASGSRVGNGQPVTLTWGFVSDGTSILDGNGGPTAPNNLISAFDATFGGSPSGANPSDLTQRPWFDFFQQSVDRWEELSGIDYVYEPNDTGQTLDTSPGILGTRADIRIAGRPIDGPDGTLAFTILPMFGSDMVFDTDDAGFYSNSSDNYVRLRNTITHELGHGFGLEHVVSNTDALLLEPAINPSFDGPQLDEVSAAHFYYGDIYEKSNNGLGNGSTSRATDLGTIALGSTKSIGTDANVPSQRIEPEATDFVSISNQADADYYSFNITEPGLLDVVLTPLGGTFNQAPIGEVPATFNANASNNLQFTVLDSNGVPLLSTVNSFGVGGVESLTDLSLNQAGEYFVRILGGPQDTIQLYQLDLSVSSESFLEADFNEDGFVNATDLNIWETAYGSTTQADADENNLTDGADFLFWQRQFGTFPPAISPAATPVPEPGTIGLLLTAVALLPSLVRRKNRVT